MTGSSLNQQAIAATLHCLTGCAIGEIAGTVIGSGLGWANTSTALLSVVLAFSFGYSLTIWSLYKSSVGFRKAAGVALASDTLSITTMEIVDTLVILLIPGALSAGPATLLFWVSLAIALVAAFCLAVPVNRYLLARGKGHTLVHNHHLH